MFKDARRSAGFTLIELLTTLVVIVVVLAVGIPSITSLRARSQLVEATNRLTAALNLARSEAVKQGIGVDVVAAGGDWNAGWSVRDADGNTLRVFDALSSGVTVSGAITTISFAALGNTSTAGCLDVSREDGGERSILLSPGGRMSVCNTDCQSVSDDPAVCRP